MSKRAIVTVTAIILAVAAGIILGLVNLTPERLPEVDDARAVDAALAALEDCVRKNPVDSNQIAGAGACSVQLEEDLIHVVLVKDISYRDAQGRVAPAGMHIAYFHVYLNAQYEIVKTVRGPDEVS